VIRESRIRKVYLAELPDGKVEVLPVLMKEQREFSSSVKLV
jgi:hypothetical protein